MPKKLPKFLLFLGLLFFFASCSAAKLFYSYGDSITSWQLDSYFDLTKEQEDWVEDRMRMHLEWHRNEELPSYRRFLLDIQKSAKDGLTMSELDEGYSRFGTKVGRIFERLIPDAALFLSEISPEQINNLERVMGEENKEMMKRELAGQIQKRVGGEISLDRILLSNIDEIVDKEVLKSGWELSL